MLPVLEKLLVLQDRDRRIAQLKAERTRIPEQIAATDQRLKAESAHLDSLRDKAKHIEADRKKLEIDVESKRTQIAKYRTQLSLIKSNTEYQALLKEIAKAEQEIDAIETHELEIMEKGEQLQPGGQAGAGGTEGNYRESGSGTRRHAEAHGAGRRRIEAVAGRTADNRARGRSGRPLSLRATDA